jgi:hypothetical protein
VEIGSTIRLGTGLLTLLIQRPIFMFIWYSILLAIHADRLLWFLFWIYVPLISLLDLVEIIVKNVMEEK